MGKGLIFYFYVNKETIYDELTNLHIKFLTRFKKDFNKIKFAIAMDDINDMELYNHAVNIVFEIFGGLQNELSILPFKHNEGNGLTNFFKIEYIEKIHEYDYVYFTTNLIPDSFIADKVMLKKWISLNYYYNLECFNEVQKELSFKRHNAVFYSPCLLGNEYTDPTLYYYCDNHFWLNSKAIYNIIKFSEENPLPEQYNKYFIIDFFVYLQKHKGILTTVNNSAYYLSYDNIFDINIDIKEVCDNLGYFTEDFNNFYKENE
jgi:hypothetical protein